MAANPAYPVLQIAMGGRKSRPATERAPPDTKIELGAFAIDEYRPIKVIVIGAGFSGILAGIRYARLPRPHLGANAHRAPQGFLRRFRMLT